MFKAFWKDAKSWFQTGPFAGFSKNLDLVGDASYYRLGCVSSQTVIITVPIRTGDLARPNPNRDPKKKQDPNRGQDKIGVGIGIQKTNGIQIGIQNGVNPGVHFATPGPEVAKSDGSPRFFYFGGWWMMDDGTKLMDDGTKITKFPYVFGQEKIQNLVDDGDWTNLVDDGWWN